MSQYSYAKIHPFSFGVALGIVWGLGIFVMGLIAWKTGLGLTFVESLRTGYVGYAATLRGSIIGGIWGFVDLFLAGVIIAVLYNLVLKVFSAPEDRSVKK